MEEKSNPTPKEAYEQALESYRQMSEIHKQTLDWSSYRSGMSDEELVEYYKAEDDLNWEYERVEEARKYYEQSLNPFASLVERSTLQHELAHAKLWEDVQSEMEENLYQELLEGKQTQQCAKLSSWLVRILPEDWRSDLDELHRVWLSEGRSRLVVSLITLRVLLEMLWAGIWIKWEDFISPRQQEIR